MDIALKQRLIGAVLLIFLGILVIPMLLEAERPALVEPLPELADSRELVFTHRALPDDADQPAVQPMPGRGGPQPPPLPSMEQWHIQVGVFQDAGNARKILDKMRGAGYPTELFPKQAGGRVQQRVWVGPYDSQQEAEHVLAGIKAKQNLTEVHQGWVVRRP